MFDKSLTSFSFVNPDLDLGILTFSNNVFISVVAYNLFHCTQSSRIAADSSLVQWRFINNLFSKYYHVYNRLLSICLSICFVCSFCLC